VIALLVLGSALLHALWNALLRRQDDKPAAGVLVVTIATGCAALAALATLLWPSSGLGGGASLLPSGALGFTFGAGLFEAIYFVSLVAALERCPLPPVYTTSRGTAIALVWPLSIAFLGETLRSTGVAGTVLVGAGLLVSGLEGTGSGADAGDAQARRRGLRLAVLSGVGIAGYHLCYKGALAAGGAPPAVFTVALGLALPFNFARLGPGWRPRLASTLRARPLGLMALGITCAASFLLLLWALGAGGAGWVLTLRNSSVVFAVVLGTWLGEPASRRQWLGAVLVAAGAVVLGVGR
jgi:uncharacterized membrane protein